MDISYTPIKLRKISIENAQYPSENTILKLIEKGYKNAAFSTFPKLIDSIPSHRSYFSYNSGNCISLSYRLKFLFKKNNIKSYLIPATIPNVYKNDGYLDLSHVALAIPYGLKGFYICDPAFYFLCPAFISIKKKYEPNSSIFDVNSKPISQILFSKNIYSIESSEHLKDYDTIEIVEYSKNYYKDGLKLNKYQHIPADTYSCECCFKTNRLDKWEYFICSVLNPESSISSFFYKIKKEPFILTTSIDENGIILAEYHIRVRGDSIEISYRNSNDKLVSKDDLTKIYDIVNIKKLKKYFKKKDVVEMLRDYFTNIEPQ